MANNISVMDQHTRVGRIFILERIRDQKHILFGKFTDSLKKHDKEKAWNKIAEDAISFGHFPSNRNGGYLRDTTWQNWRKRFVEKRDKKMEYERHGGGLGSLKKSKVEFDEADILIADILGAREKTSRNHHAQNWVKLESINGGAGTSTSSSSNSLYAQNFLEVGVNEEGLAQYYPETLESDDLEEYGEEEEEDYEVNGGSSDHPDGYVNSVHEELEATVSVAKPPTGPLEGIRQQQGEFYAGASALLVRGSQIQRKRPSHSYDNDSRNLEADEEDLRESLSDKKLRLEVDLLEMESYKRRLEILQLERHLGLPSSKITREILRKS